MPLVPVERCLSPRELTEPRLAPGGDRLGFAVSSDGSSWIEVHDLTGASGPHLLACTPSLRPGRGLGGGAWCFTADGAALVHVAVDGNLWRRPIDGSPPARLTDHGPDRAASSPVVAPDGHHVVYTVDQAEVWCTSLTGTVARRLDRGTADFCLDPWVFPDGTVRWLAWDVPDMPWDHSRVDAAMLDGTPLPSSTVPAAVQQPRCLPDGTPLWVRDDDGWLNVWAGDRALVAEPFEHAGPTWGPGQRSFVPSPDGRFVAFTRNERGFGRLCVVDVATGEVREVAKAVHGQLGWEGDRLAALRTGARTPTQVVVYDTRTWERTTVAVGPHGDWADDELVEPELVEVDTGDGTVHARLYRAARPDGRLIVWLHGGPTDQWQVTFMPRIAYWRARGWSILVPDHRGSTGHGRDYQQALRGRWGELDVADSVAAARVAHERGWGVPQGTVLMGSSAGGFTALGALAAEPERFAGAAVLFPVTDLLDLTERSHRFERHSTDTLVGPLPDASATFRERSPVWHTSRFASRPILVLHGDADPVVPVDQSMVFAERVRAAGGDIELVVYPGEGHGFRTREHQLDEYARVAAFVQRAVRIGSVP